MTLVALGSRCNDSGPSVSEASFHVSSRNMANLGYIQVTRRCNQSCQFCSNPPIEAERSLEGAKELVDDLLQRGYDGVILTGGEPTLEPFLPELVAYCLEVGIPARLITNGTKLCNPELLDTLIDGGLHHCHLSLHSPHPHVHDDLTGNPGGHAALLETLKLVGTRQERITADINAVITSKNADHLDALAKMIVEEFPHVRHFVFNGLDPDTDRLREHDSLIPRLRDFELSLARAADVVESSGRTLRVERVPLCFMAGFEHCSTETRKIVKAEERTTHFLDRRGAVRQGPEAFFHRHYSACEVCTLKVMCAGLYEREAAYDPGELAPQFIDPEPIRKKILTR